MEVLLGHGGGGKLLVVAKDRHTVSAVERDPGRTFTAKDNKDTSEHQL